MMEDAATAEISRSQLWFWVFHGCTTDKGTKITASYIDKILDEETAIVKKTGLDAGRTDLSARYLKDQIRSKALSDFLTTDLTYVPPLLFTLRWS
jgi:malate synthase